jgi:hypothetical protein
MKVILLLLLLTPILTIGQNSQLSMFNNLVDKKWKAEGTWGKGFCHFIYFSANETVHTRIFLH